MKKLFLIPFLLSCTWIENHPQQVKLAEEVVEEIVVSEVEAMAPSVHK